MTVVRLPFPMFAACGWRYMIEQASLHLTQPWAEACQGPRCAVAQNRRMPSQLVRILDLDPDTGNGAHE